MYIVYCTLYVCIHIYAGRSYGARLLKKNQITEKKVTTHVTLKSVGVKSKKWIEVITIGHRLKMLPWRRACACLWTGSGCWNWRARLSSPGQTQARTPPSSKNSSSDEYFRVRQKQVLLVFLSSDPTQARTPPSSSRNTVNYWRKKSGFHCIKSRHCAYMIYRVKKNVIA